MKQEVADSEVSEDSEVAAATAAGVAAAAVVAVVPPCADAEEVVAPPIKEEAASPTPEEGTSTFIPIKEEPLRDEEIVEKREVKNLFFCSLRFRFKFCDYESWLISCKILTKFLIKTNILSD